MNSGAAILLALVTAAAVPRSAVAKDLPRGATVPRSTGCEAFGPDFRKMDGTDTCIRISGSVRVETSVSTGSGGGFWSAARAR